VECLDCAFLVAATAFGFFYSFQLYAVVAKGDIAVRTLFRIDNNSVADSTVKNILIFSIL